MKRLNFPSRQPLGEYPIRRVEQILEERNIDGKVPYDIAMRILDDMAVVSSIIRDWPCKKYDKLGLHLYCPNHGSSAAA